MATRHGQEDDRLASLNGDNVIRIRGARVHNLKNVDVDIPRDRLVVITGPSGSGKSSLAIDTLFAEGERQYVESLSTYARQFLNQMERPDVDLIEGLQPTICIDQRPGSQNPRSTVATVTEIYDYLRVLMARLGEPLCYQCGTPIRQQTPEQIRDRLLLLPEGTKLMLLAPLVRGRKGKHQEVLARIRKAGLVRVRVDDEVYDIDNVPDLSAGQAHRIEAVVDRIIVRKGIDARLAESLALAVEHGEGRVVACYLENGGEGTPPGTWRDELFSTLYACPTCNLSYEELEPRTFSFNSPYGACSTCDGLGRLEDFDPDLIVPDREKSLDTGAVAPWKGSSAAVLRKRQKAVEPFLQSHGTTWQSPLAELSEEVYRQFLYGDGGDFPGLVSLLNQQFATETDESERDRLATYRGQTECPACGASRLRPEATHVRLGGKAIHQITALAVSQAGKFFSSLSFASHQQPIGQPLVAEIVRRLEFLERVGVPYLTLDRAADTLSGGEHQRVRLATAIGSGLVGVCYVLDEPSIGLHPRDNQRLIDSLRDLQQQGNTVVVVEHDEAMMRQADLLIDVGPEAGAGGGRIMAVGTPAEVEQNENSLTGGYLSDRFRIDPPPARRPVAKTRSLVLEGVTTHNLQDVRAVFPLEALVCVTGVSGSGKSSLVSGTLAPAVIRRLGGAAPKPGPFKSLRGLNQLERAVVIDQAPIGRTPRSNAATFTGAFDEVRKVFANTREARARGYRASRFSFNVKGGRCEACQGQGLQKIEMNFLPDLYVPCETCGGARFNRQTLQVHYRGKSIADALAMPVREAAQFFENFVPIHRVLQSLDDVGLGYLPLGQPSTTLSGGEAQRIKLATGLARAEGGKTLYILDEPTTGLHFEDVKRLLAVLRRLVERGDTVIVIEHNLDVIKSADWVLDLGPEGGQGGGRIIAEGAPEDVARMDASYTGHFLRQVLGFTNPAPSQ